MSAAPATDLGEDSSCDITTAVRFDMSAVSANLSGASPSSDDDDEDAKRAQPPALEHSTTTSVTRFDVPSSSSFTRSPPDSATASPATHLHDLAPHLPLDDELQLAMQEPMPPRTPDPTISQDHLANDPWLPGPADGAFIRKPGKLWRPTFPNLVTDSEAKQDEPIPPTEEEVQLAQARQAADVPRVPPPAALGSAIGHTTAASSYATPGQELLLRSDLSADARAKLDYSTPVEDRLRSLLRKSGDAGSPSTFMGGLPVRSTSRQSVREDDLSSAPSSRPTSATASPTKSDWEPSTPSSSNLKAQLSSAGDQVRNFFQTLPTPQFASTNDTDLAPSATPRDSVASSPSAHAGKSAVPTSPPESDNVPADWLALQKARLQNLFDRASSVTTAPKPAPTASEPPSDHKSSTGALASQSDGAPHPEVHPDLTPGADELVTSIALPGPPVPHLTPPPKAAVRTKSDDELPASVLAARHEKDFQPETHQPVDQGIVPKLLRKQSDWQPPRLPVVFVHGLFGFSELKLSNLSISYWRGATEALLANGCEVLICHLPTAASIQERAAALKAEVEERFAGREVNLIAHSMGGLDCRYLISRLSHGRARFTFKVATLTTITTPHRGSSFADYMLEKVVGVSRVPKLVSVLTALGVPGGGRAFEDLTTERMVIFNLTCPDRPDVRYYSWGAEFTPTLLSEFRFPHGIIFSNEGPNDGLVSVESSKWGQFQGTLTDVSHLAIIGWNNSNKSPTTTSSSSSWLPTWTPPAWSPFKKKGTETPPPKASSSNPASPEAASPTPASATTGSTTTETFSEDSTRTTTTATGFDVSSFYLQICEDLAKDGF